MELREGSTQELDLCSDVLKEVLAGLEAHTGVWEFCKRSDETEPDLYHQKHDAKAAVSHYIGDRYGKLKPSLGRVAWPKVMHLYALSTLFNASATSTPIIMYGVLQIEGLMTKFSTTVGRCLCDYDSMIDESMGSSIMGSV